MKSSDKEEIRIGILEFNDKRDFAAFEVDTISIKNDPYEIKVNTANSTSFEGANSSFTILFWNKFHPPLKRDGSQIEKYLKANANLLSDLISEQKYRPLSSISSAFLKGGIASFTSTIQIDRDSLFIANSPWSEKIFYINRKSAKEVKKKAKDETGLENSSMKHGEYINRIALESIALLASQPTPKTLSILCPGEIAYINPATYETISVANKLDSHIFTEPQDWPLSEVATSGHKKIKISQQEQSKILPFCGKKIRVDPQIQEIEKNLFQLCGKINTINTVGGRNLQQLSRLYLCTLGSPSKDFNLLEAKAKLKDKIYMQNKTPFLDSSFKLSNSSLPPDLQYFYHPSLMIHGMSKSLYQHQWATMLSFLDSINE